MPAFSILVYTDGEVIGDGIIRLAFARALKHALPGCHITWLSSEFSAYQNVLAPHAKSWIDRLVVLPQRRIPQLEYLTGCAAVRGQTFDLIIDTQRNAKRSFWLTRLKHRQFASASAKGWFASAKLPPDLSPHFHKRLLQLGSMGTGQTLADLPPIQPDELPLTTATQLLPDGARYIGFIVGAGHPDKCWPRAQFIALAQQVAAQGDVPVIFLGPKELEWRAEFAAAVPSALFPLQAVADATPSLTMALGTRLSAAIANDSGGAHLLAAVDTPLVTLFRAASVRTKFLPRGARVTALAPEDFGVATMQEIPLGAVADALTQLQK